MSELRKKIEKQIEAIATQLYGIEDIIKIFCLAKASDLTVLLIGEHGIAKSSLARLWTDTMLVRDEETGEYRPMTFRIVTSSEVDDSLIAHPDIAVFRAENRLVMKRGELMIKDHIFIDELYLWSNKYRAKLHQLLEEKTYAGLSVLTKTYTFACLDVESEILTQNGWKKWNEVSTEDKVLSFNVKTQKLEWKPVLAVWIYDYQDLMYSVEDRDLSLLVTPNHRFLLWDKLKGSFVWRIALDLKKQRDMIIQSAEVELPERNSHFSDDFVRLIAWLKTEGHLPKGYNTLQIYQSEGLFVDEIRALLTKLSLDFTEHTRVRPNLKKEYIFTIKAKDGKWIKEIVKDKILRVSDLKLPKRQLEILYETLLKGDGWRRKDNREVFISKEKETIDTFQILATFLGKRCHVKCEKRGKYTIWRAYVTNKRKHLIRRGKLIPYKGKVWCITTEYGNFLIRRNGKVHVTGNTNPLTEWYSGQIETRNLACYSDDTEILTTSGWKKYTELTDNEEIFTLNPETKEIEIENIQKLYLYHYAGKLYHFSSQQIDWLVTPNHRLWVLRDKKKGFEFVEARELFGQPFEASKTGEWRNGKEYPEDLMRILGYYLADGFPRINEKTGHYGISLVLGKEELVKKAISSLERLGFKPHLEKNLRITVWNKELWSLLAPLGKAWEKYIPKEFKEAKKESLRVLLEAYFEGDGWKIGNQWLAKTTSPKLRDDLQEIALKCGWAINYTLDSKPHSSYSPKLKRVIHGRHQSYILHLIKKRLTPRVESISSKNRSLNTKEEWVDYDGIVWCPKTKNGILYIRRNGKPSWSGNTEDRIDLFIPMFQPDITSSQRMIKKFGKYGKKTLPLEKVATWDDYEKMREEIHEINLPSDKLVWLSLLAEECSACKYTPSKFDIGQATMSLKCKECNRNQNICARVGLSKPRFLRATVLLAKALAWYDGRKEVIWQDLYTAIKYTMPHRLIFLQKQVNILDAPKEIDEIIRMFNEDMEQWKNRDVFNKLEKIIIASKEEPPKYLKDDVQALLVEIQEDLPILNYSKEVINLAQKRVKKYYEEKVKTLTPEKLDEFRDELDSSGLDEYAKSDILSIIGIEYVPKRKRQKESKQGE